MLDDRHFHVHNGPPDPLSISTKKEKRREKTYNGFLNPLSISTGLRFDKIDQTMYSVGLLIRGLYRMLFVH